MSAHLYVRRLTRGGSSIQVKWRDRDLGRWRSETFDGDDGAAAAEFRAAVTAAGDRLPRGWVPGRGWAWALPDVVTLDDVYDDWVRWQQQRVAKNLLKASTLVRYQSDYEAHVRSKQIRFFQRDEWQLFRACLNPDVHDLVATMLATALRRGEVSALQVGDLVDGAGGQLVIHVRRSWAVRGSQTPRDQWLPGETARWEISHPKTRKERVVVVSGQLANQLRSMQNGRPSEDWLFTTARDNPWRHRDFHSDRWTPALRHASHLGLSRHFTPHMLRHTCVVWSLHAGVPIDVVSHMLGHSSIKTTYDEYGGLLHLTDDRMAQAMSAAMSETTSTTLGAAMPSPDEVATRKVRPGTRQDQRRRRAA